MKLDVDVQLATDFDTRVERVRIKATIEQEAFERVVAAIERVVRQHASGAVVEVYE